MVFYFWMMMMAVVVMMIQGEKWGGRWIIYPKKSDENVQKFLSRNVCERGEVVGIKKINIFQNLRTLPNSSPKGGV